MDTANSTSDDALTEAYLLAAQKMADGAPVQEIRISLMGKGFTHEAATTMISEVAEAQSEVANEAAEEMIKSGAFWCFGGILVTCLTYNAAAAHGGTYVVAFGAILYGALQLLQGFSQSKKQ